jgi:SAM-dependent methyltransferase
MSTLAFVHEKFVHSRRVDVLSRHIAELLPQGASVLDVGCGDGLLASVLKRLRPDIEIEGIDTLVRSETHVPVTGFDGTTIPYPDGTFDVSLFVDVLHHTDKPQRLMEEALRVSKGQLLIKDHLRNGLIAAPTLRFMDWVGNKRYGVALPYNYLSIAQWDSAFDKLAVRKIQWRESLGLYPFPASLIFDRRLHFIALLKK